MQSSFMLATWLLATAGLPQASGQVKTKKYNAQTNQVYWPSSFNPQNKGAWYVHNEIDIAAPPAVVWQILIEAQQWHSFYKGVEAPITFADRNVQALAPNTRFNFKTMGLKFQPTVQEYVPHERLAWAIEEKRIKAYHAWVIVPTVTGCRLISPEVQFGFLTKLQKLFQPNKLLNLHEVWLNAIKQRAENRQTQQMALAK
ncbi:MAG TPA: SRPBCC domain-containing protein [Phnomibacter sp.]|nr:SRPBCC domain-containing protein [Phnomibacter sp.]